ncbi:histone-lysine N-methyltransferase SETMAR-like [Tachypleus tridentatus]|uniref:histone-lysine N-methyltransferase SETMAR-like n=1 Tax=Tachypleus tridentatus TaxID=6853 RepID=UPI003FD49CD4
MDVSEEPIRHIMLYEFKKSNSAVETTQNIQGIYGAESLNERKCQRWFQKFRSGDYSLSDSPCSSRPVEFNDDLLLAALDEYYAVTVELVQKCDLTHLTVHCHLQELGKVLELGKLVPHDLREANLRARVHICTSLLYLEHSSPLLSKIVTGDERWIFYKMLSAVDNDSLQGVRQGRPLSPSLYVLMIVPALSSVSLGFNVWPSFPRWGIHQGSAAQLNYTKSRAWELGKWASSADTPFDLAWASSPVKCFGIPFIASPEAACGKMV